MQIYFFHISVLYTFGTGFIVKIMFITGYVLIWPKQETVGIGDLH
jgi:hypothetical protein